ncbi:hypothetical protein [Longimicrobium sp.]|uniref:hypothetical protein n=1 Tax=Longimicrobium sp. TaxID=2029185 RepID=UPI002B7BDD3D|nr:hypothetical protein [Longimicrobium sp.]HSU13181.1 hypothetical protein [Longimicrobium sp.]
MKKMRLQMDELRVESFTTGSPRVERGTVQGHDSGAPGDARIQDPVDGSANELCTSPSYLETCILYTCGGCDSADPQYC